MVTRKPVPQSANRPSATNPSSPPYPTTPISTNSTSSFRNEGQNNAIQSGTDLEPNSADIWNEERIGARNDVHGASQAQSHLDPNSLPDALKVGPSNFTPKSSQEALKPNAAITNPFILRRQQSQGAASDGKESSAHAWGENAALPAQPTQPPPPPPLPQVTEQFSNMDVSGHNTNPWQPEPNDKQLPVPHIQREDSGNDAWSTAQPPNNSTPLTHPASSPQPVLLDIDEPESPAWDEDDDDDSDVSDKPTHPTNETEQISEDRHAWDTAASQIPRQDVPIAVQQSGQDDSINYNEGWNLVDHELTPGVAQQSGVVGADGAILSRMDNENIAPALPPRRAEENPPPQPPRPTVNTTNRSTSSLATPGTPGARNQKKETYEIKKITWHDVNAQHNPRVSPILVQNANGPCPLLALVNALTLSTPANVETALVETLRSREQVSLGLLLDAVFDELMSGRRGDAAQELPDVSELYAFLLTLHTGMNVNPLFASSQTPEGTNHSRNSLSMGHIHPVERQNATPGLFEETKEMKLYGTFSVPLIHGWLPRVDSPAYVALSRSAKSYEDAQNLMFREEELEDKLAHEGLSFEEQATLEDIATIKAFLNTAATQLTSNGLDIITKSLEPGAVAILFRNDHFSTLYKHPNGMLLQLVTDSGYAGHEEVVWEGLLDVNGERAEFFSGDFRLVGGASAATTQENNTAGWTTVTGRRNNSNATGTSQAAAQPSLNVPHGDEGPQSPSTEQEDHDFALALQLQEEEDERQRNEEARRRRETELSQQYIEQQGGTNNNVPVTQRGGSGRGNSVRGTASVRGSPSRGRGTPQGRPAVPPRRSNLAAAPPPVDPEAGVDVPPPTYEEAATESPYHPPANHPAHPSADPARRSSSYTATSPQLASGPNHPSATVRRNRGSFSGRGRGQTLFDQIRNTQNSGQPVPNQAPQERERDCIIM
ncbi:DUF544 domain-containing protein [Rutstroemia sp. NJR-2017a BVV2]|nr:DUF544 domain-containing protein [Rutstroemia sp. NJR-2017a BVV2]